MKKIDLACIIDDDPIFVFGAKKIMQLGDICNSFMVFANGEEALQNLTAVIKANEKLPDVILLDLNMPIMDGWQFLDEFVKVPCEKEIIIYIATSSIDPADLDKAKEYDSVSNYLIKPITIASLKDVFENFGKEKV